MYSRLWLEDKKLQEAGDLIEAWFNRLMCAANECDFRSGRFEFSSAPLPAEFIARKARITLDQFDKVKRCGFLGKDESGVFYIKNWEKYQDKTRLHRHGARVGADTGAEDGANKKLRTEELKNLRTEERNKDTAEFKRLSRILEDYYETLKKPNIGSRQESQIRTNIKHFEEKLEALNA